MLSPATGSGIQVSSSLLLLIMLLPLFLSPQPCSPSCLRWLLPSAGQSTAYSYPAKYWLESHWVSQSGWAPDQATGACLLHSCSLPASGGTQANGCPELKAVACLLWRREDGTKRALALANNSMVHPTLARGNYHTLRLKARGSSSRRVQKNSAAGKSYNGQPAFANNVYLTPFG